MKTTMKPFNLLFALILLVSGCSSSSSGDAPLAAGGAGVVIDQVPGTATAANFASAIDVNDKNQVVGFIETTAGAPFKATLWTVDSTGSSTATPTALPPIAGNVFSAGFSIDEAGTVVGQSAKGSRLVAVLWPGGATAPVELPALHAAGNSVAYGISADGTWIVGEAQNAALTTRAVIWRADTGGAFTAAPVVLPVNLAGGPFSSANGVARVAGNQIWIAGTAEDEAGVSRAMLWRSNDGLVFTATDLRTAGEAGSTALAVSTTGQVVGESETSPGNFAAVRWTADNSGVFYRTVLAANGIAMAINNSGKVVGTAAGSATAWNTAALISGTTTLFTTPSQAYGSNNGDGTGYLVVGVNNGKGFVKKVN